MLTIFVRNLRSFYALYEEGANKDSKKSFSDVTIKQEPRMNYYQIY
jgi:hypothetical protein